MLASLDVTLAFGVKNLFIFIVFCLKIKRGPSRNKDLLIVILLLGNTPERSIEETFEKATS